MRLFSFYSHYLLVWSLQRVCASWNPHCYSLSCLCDVEWLQLPHLVFRLDILPCHPLCCWDFPQSFKSDLLIFFISTFWDCFFLSSWPLWNSCFMSCHHHLLNFAQRFDFFTISCSSSSLISLNILIVIISISLLWISSNSFSLRGHHGRVSTFWRSYAVLVSCGFLGHCWDLHNCRWFSFISYFLSREVSTVFKCGTWWSWVCRSQNNCSVCGRWEPVVSSLSLPMQSVNCWTLSTCRCDSQLSAVTVWSMLQF